MKQYKNDTCSSYSWFMVPISDIQGRMFSLIFVWISILRTQRLYLWSWQAGLANLPPKNELRAQWIMGLVSFSEGYKSLIFGAGQDYHLGILLFSVLGFIELQLVCSNGRWRKTGPWTHKYGQICILRFTSCQQNLKPSLWSGHSYHFRYSMHIATVKEKIETLDMGSEVTLVLMMKVRCPPIAICFFMTLKLLKRQMSSPALWTRRLKSTSSQVNLTRPRNVTKSPSSISFNFCMTYSTMQKS